MAVKVTGSETSGDFPKFFGAMLFRTKPSDADKLFIAALKWGISFVLGPDKEMWYFGDKVPDYREAFSISCTGLFVDVGAYEGAYVERNLRAEKVVAFEPNPAVFGRLSRRFARFGNVNSEELAILDRQGRVSLSVPSVIAGHQMLSSTTIMRGTSVEVRCTTIDSYFADEPWRKDCAMKIDTEGAEHQVLQGAKGFISRFSPRLMVEYHDNLSELIGDLLSMGYDGEVIRDQSHAGWKERGWILAEARDPASDMRAALTSTAPRLP